MKLKVLTCFLLSLFISGTVFAAPLGEYKGMPIVKLVVNGNVVTPEVPAHIEDGSTFLPLRAVSESLGAKVDWNQDTYTATVTAQSGINKDALATFPGGIKFESENGFIVSSSEYVQKVSYAADWPDVWQTIDRLSTVAADKIRANYLDKNRQLTGTITVNRKDIEDYHKGIISVDKMSSLITFTGNLGNTGNLGIKEIAKLKDRVGFVLALDASGNPFSQGSGFMIEPYYFITNYHVAENSRELQISLDGTTYSTKGYYLFGNKQSDVYGAIIGTEYDTTGRVTKGLPQKTFKISTKLPEVGDKVYAIGSPEGLENTVTEGIVSGIRNINGITKIQHTADIYYGSSGGPLLNESGEVIGITSGGVDGTGIKWAIPIGYVQQEIDKLH